MEQKQDIILSLPASLTKGELAEKMGIHRNTLRERLVDMGITGRRRLTVAQLLHFFGKFPPPGEYVLNLTK